MGLHHGAYCVACCWGLMIVLIAVGTIVGVALIARALLAIWHPWLLPGLHMKSMTAVPGM